MPSRQDVRDAVLTEISRASGVPRRALDDKQKLRDDLGISHQNFVQLAQNLRTFVQGHNPRSTLLLREIETAAATVGSVVGLVQERVTA